MLITGVWLLCPDGVVRPVLRGEVRSAQGTLVQTPFLVDTAADRTVFSAAVLQTIGLTGVRPLQELGGVGGMASSTLVETEIRFPRERGGEAIFRGQFAAVTEEESLDMSVLGWDVTNLFAVIVDRPSDFVALLGQRHRYRVDEV